MTRRRGWQTTGIRTRSSCDRRDQAAGLESEEEDGGKRGGGKEKEEEEEEAGRGG